MGVGSKIKWRVYGFSVAALIVLSFFIGVIYALLLVLLAFLSWKAYDSLRLMHWWKKESAISREMIEYINERLNEGIKSRNLWVQGLVLPEVAKFALDYRVELMARPRIIEKESSNPVDGWTEWGAARLDDLMNASPELLGDNIGSEENPLLMGRMLIARAGFEVLVAEHALRLLNVKDPREAIVQKTLAAELTKVNALREKGDLGQQLVGAARAEAFSSALRALSAELGEAKS